MKVEKLLMYCWNFNEYFVAIAENAKRQSKNNLIRDDNNSIDIHTDFMEQAFNKPCPSRELKCTTMKEIEQIIKFLKTKKLVWVQQDIDKDSENKLPFHKFSTKLHM